MLYIRDISQFSFLLNKVRDFYRKMFEVIEFLNQADGHSILILRDVLI